MSEAYRQKLLNWWCSMLVLLLLAISAIAARWLFYVPFMMMMTEVESVRIEWMLDPMLHYFIWFLPLAFWHVADAFQLGQPSGRWARAIASYPAMIGSFLLLSTTLVFMASGLWESSGFCGGSFLILMQACAFPSLAFRIPANLSLWFLLILCMGKTVISIRSRSKKAP